jgi:hypothetical protein
MAGNADRRSKLTTVLDRPTVTACALDLQVFDSLRLRHPPFSAAKPWR